MLCKIKNRRGESLIETLASMLIAALAMLMFAQLLSAAARVTKRGRDWNADINQLNTFLEARPTEPEKIEELRDKLNTLESGEVIPEEGPLWSGTIAITDEDGALIEQAPVTFYVAHYGGEDVISYGRSS